MLTKQDLKQIQTIFQEEILPLKEDVSVLKEDVSVLKEDVSVLKEDVSVLKKDMVTVKEDISQVRKDMKMIVSFFDREYLELRKRVERIENHLDLPQSS